MRFRLALAGLLVAAAYGGVALTTATAQEESAKKVIAIEVRVPKDAKVEIDGNKTTSTGETRRYETPLLDVGPQYRYELKVIAGGKTITRQISVRSGGKNIFDLRGDFAVAKGVGSLTEEEALAIATDAYVYGYPLVTMEMTRRVMTNVATPKDMRGPMGQFVNARDLSGRLVQRRHGPQR